MDRDWNLVPGVIIGAKDCPYPREKPARYAEMLAVVERLSANPLFCCVDLCYVNDKIYFGGMTMTRTGLLFPFTDAFLAEQGKKLTLPT